MICSHKTANDHSVLVQDKRLWTCSACGASGTWTETWGYFGNIECKRCWMAQIDHVHCSDACKATLAARYGITDGAAPRAPREKKVPMPKAAAWERKALAAGWTKPGGAT